jgi:large subunit ribosomal protein L25
VKPDEKFEIRIPILLSGEAFGVKNQSGVLEVNTHTLRIRTLPNDMPSVIEVDVTALKVGETIKLGELKPIAGVEFLDSKGQVVVACVEPVAEVVVEAPVAAAAPAEGAAAPAADGKAPPAADGKPAPAGDAKAGAAPAAGAKAGAAPAKPAAGAKPAAPAKK